MSLQTSQTGRRILGNVENLHISHSAGYIVSIKMGQVTFSAQINTSGSFGAETSGGSHLSLVV